MSTEIVFPHTGADFSGYYDASDWLADNGYVIGAMQTGAPIGVHRKVECLSIAKWRNLSPKERRTLDGKLEATTGRFRDGDARLTLIRPIE